MAETDPLRALTLYSDLLGREPSNFEAHMRMATLLEREGDLSGALRHLLGAAVIVPANAVWDDFFDAPAVALPERDEPHAQEREKL